MQVSTFPETCQFLNIWTQDLTPDELKPVMVFLHSGGFASGSSVESISQNLGSMSKFGDVVTSVDALKKVDYDDLIAAATDVFSELQESGEITGMGWAPVVDGDYYPEPACKDGVFTELAANIPTIVGTNFSEFGSNGQSAVNNWGPDYIISDLTEEDVAERLSATYGDKVEDIITAFKEAYLDHPVQDVLYINFRAWMRSHSSKLLPYEAFKICRIRQYSPSASPERHIENLHVDGRSTVLKLMVNNHVMTQEEADAFVWPDLNDDFVPAFVTGDARFGIEPDIS